MGRNIKSLIVTRKFSDTYDENESKIVVKDIVHYEQNPIQIVAKDFVDTYNENESKLKIEDVVHYEQNPVQIVVEDFTDTYDEYSSRIVSRLNLVSKYVDDYDMLRASEMEMERQRTLKNSSLFGVSMKSTGVDIAKGILQPLVSSISPTNLLGSIKNVGLQSLIMYGRAVGPLEELPIMDYIQGGNGLRAASVLSNTQTRAEHKFLSKLYQQKSWKNKDGVVSENRYPINELPGAGVDLPVRTYDNKGLYLTNNAETLPALVNQVNTKLSVNRWKPSEEYPNFIYDDLLANLENGGKFDFLIFNSANQTLLSLPAHISDVNENVSVNWESVSLINRSEDLYIYNRASRDFSVSFYVFYTNNGDQDVEEYGPIVTIGMGIDKVIREVGTVSKTKMWKSMEFLHTLTRPRYGDDGTFIAAPYCKLKVGDLFDHDVIVEAVSIAYNDLIWDINIGLGKNNDGIKPMMANITLSGKILHGGSPSVGSQFYPKRSGGV